MSIRLPQNPGIGGLDELTTTEETFVQTGAAGVILLLETTAPSATSGYGKLYVKSSDSNLYFKDDGGSETQLTGAGSSGATAALDNLASVAINTSLVSDTDVTDDLGSTTKKWNNLFVASIGATGTRITKLWATDIESTNMPTVGGTSLSSTFAPLTSPTFSTSITGSYLTASEILITDGSKNIVSAPVATYPSLTELTYVKGVTSAIQTQLGAKASTALSNLSSVAINTTLVSDTDNTDALGTAAISWSDLFLGSGSVITWSTAPSTPDVTLTHSANTLTLAGGLLSLGAGITVVGTTTLDTGLTGVLRADSGVVSVDTDVTDLVSAATSSAAGKVELAIAAEVTTGTDADRAITPDALAGSTIFGRKSVSIQVFSGATDVTTGDGKAYITIPEALNGMNLVRAQATVVTAGTTNATTVMIHNKTDTADMLSGAISIASGGTVGTVGSINGAADDVATNDILRVDVDSVSTTAPQGLMVILEFQLP